MDEELKQIEKGNKSDKTIHEPKEANGLMKIWKSFSHGLTDTDMKSYKKIYQLPYWTGKKFPSVKEAVQVEIDAHERRSKILHDDYGGDLGRIQDEIPKDPETLKSFRDLIWEWEGRKFPEKYVPTKVITRKTDGDIQEELIIHEKHYEEVEAYLKKQGVEPKVLDAFMVVRKKLDQKLVEVDNTIRIEKLDPTLIEEYRSMIGKINNYFPHRRTGNAYMTIVDIKEQDPEKKTVYREHFNSFAERMPWKTKANERGLKYINEKLGGDTSRYEVNAGFVKQLPDEVFFQIPVEQMQQILGEAGTELTKLRTREKAKQLVGAAKREGKILSFNDALRKAQKVMTADMEAALSKAVANVFKSRGFGRHAMTRKGIPGHETEDVFGILFDYLSGFAGFKTKIERAKSHHAILRNINAKKNPNEWKYVSKYARDMLANSDRTDKVVDGLRGLFFVKYLGFVPKSGMINLTQNIVVAAPILSQYTKRSHIKLGKAMYDTRRALTSKEGWTGKEIKYKNLPDIELKALREIHEEGASIDLFLRELKGNLPSSGMGKTFRKVIDKAGIFMQLAEKFNRASTGLAAFRIAYNEGVTHKGINTKNNYKASKSFAKQIIYDAHFLYGKANLPEFARGGDFQKYLRSTYTFRSFTHNYLSLMSHLATNQTPGSKKAFANSLRNLFLVGGLTSIPFFKAFAEALLWAIGDDDDDILTKAREAMPNKFLKDMIVYGIPGASAGWDFTGSLSIEFPRNWKDIMGVPYAVIEDTVNMIESIKSGQVFRAVSETPFTPISLRNIMRGLELRTEGQRTRSGRAIGKLTGTEPRKITTFEAIGKGVGIQPISSSKAFSGYKATEKLETALKERKRKWADRYINAENRNDIKTMQKVASEIEKWNKSVMNDGKPYLLVNIRDSLRNRRRPAINYVPKQLRRKALELSQTWE
ncbi:MAG: PLxRFG domain-containing protein [Nitrospirota bacterium]